MKHTPGPWYQQDGVIYADNSDRSFIIAECRDSILNANDYESNANLIAAAPDLLEALEGLTQYFAFMFKDPKFREYTKAIAAINKAKGL